MLRFMQIRNMCALLGQQQEQKYRKAEYVLRRVCFVNVQSSLHKNVVVSVCVRMDNAAYIIFIMWNFILGFEAWYHFRFDLSCGVAVTVRSHQKEISGNFLTGGGGGGDIFEGWANF